MTDANVRESKVEIAVGGLEHTGVMLTIPCGSDTTVVDRAEVTRRRWTDGRWPDTVGIAIARQDTDPDHGTTYRSASLILDRENAEPKELDNRLVEAVTKGGTIVRGRTAAVQGPLDQLIVEGVLQPLPIRFPGEHWRLANGWKTLNFHKKEADSGLHRP